MSQFQSVITFMVAVMLWGSKIKETILQSRSVQIICIVFMGKALGLNINSSPYLCGRTQNK